MNTLLTIEQAAAALPLLTDKQAGQLLRALVQVATTGTMPDNLPPVVAMAVALINAGTSNGTGEVDRRSETSKQNGTKGGRPRKKPDPTENLNNLTENLNNLTENLNNLNNLTENRFFRFCEGENCPPPTTPQYNTQEKNSLSHAHRARDGDALESLDRLQTELLNSPVWLETVAKNQGLTPPQLRELVVDFVNYLRNTLTVETLTEARIHFVNQLPQQLRRIQEQKNIRKDGNNQTNRKENERARRADAYQAAIARLAAQSDRPAASVPDPGGLHADDGPRPAIPILGEA